MPTKPKVKTVSVKNPDNRWKTPIMAGWIKKEGSKIKTWKVRYSILDESGKLFYFKKDTDSNPIKDPVIVTNGLFSMSEEKVKKSKFCIKLVLGKKKFFFFPVDPSNQIVCNEWLCALHNAGGIYNVKIFGSDIWTFPDWFVPSSIIGAMKHIESNLFVNVFNKRGKYSTKGAVKKIDAHKNVTFKKYDVYTICDIVKQYFGSLLHCTFHPMQSQMIELGKKDDEEVRKKLLKNIILKKISPKKAAFSIISKLFHLFHVISKNSKITKVDSKKLSEVFAKTLLRPKLSQESECAVVIKDMIDNYDEWFDSIINPVRYKRKSIPIKKTPPPLKKTIPPPTPTPPPTSEPKKLKKTSFSKSERKPGPKVAPIKREAKKERIIPIKRVAPKKKEFKITSNVEKKEIKKEEIKKRLVPRVNFSKDKKAPVKKKSPPITSKKVSNTTQILPQKKKSKPIKKKKNLFELGKDANHPVNIELLEDNKENKSGLSLFNRLEKRITSLFEFENDQEKNINKKGMKKDSKEVIEKENDDNKNSFINKISTGITNGITNIVDKIEFIDDMNDTQHEKKKEHSLVKKHGKNENSESILKRFSQGITSLFTTQKDDVVLKIEDENVKKNEIERKKDTKKNTFSEKMFNKITNSTVIEKLSKSSVVEKITNSKIVDKITESLDMFEFVDETKVNVPINNNNEKKKPFQKESIKKKLKRKEKEEETKKEKNEKNEKNEKRESVNIGKKVGSFFVGYFYKPLDKLADYVVDKIEESSEKSKKSEVEKDLERKNKVLEKLKK